jgi:uncharacterized membrane protein YgdD (TMEM256/DUF423 family)
MNWSATAAIALALAVILGAFGAHALRGRLDDYAMGIWEKAVFYHFIHALGLLAVSMMPRAGMLGNAAASAVCALLLAGVVVFSGSLYVLAASGIRALGAITPAGGLSFIAAWALLAYCLAAAKRP